MKSLRHTINEIESLQDLKILVETYEDIAAIRMQQIRSSVLTNRVFVDGIRGIYSEVQFSYKKAIEKLLNQKGTKKEYIKPDNGKEIALLISSDTGLYGSIIPEVIRRFEEFVLKNPHTDLAVVGKVGKTLLETKYSERSFKFYEIKDITKEGESDQIRNMLLEIVGYEKIVVFHGKYETLIRQNAVMTDISTGEIQEGQEKISKKNNRYLFEPSLKKIVTYFEEEIFASLIEQSFYESELAKYASRIIALSDATENIKNTLSNERKAKKRILHRIQNQKQQETLSSISLWQSS